MANIDNLNFKVILDDVDFNTKIKKDIEAAKAANVQLSALLTVKQRLNSISASDAASAKRALDIEAKRAQAAAVAAAAQEKVKQAVQQTAVAQSKASAAQNKAAEAYQRAAEAQERTRLAQQRTTTEANRSAEAAERVRTAAERTAAAQVRLQTEQTKSAIAAERLKQAQQQTAAAAQRAQDSMSKQSRLLKQLTTMAATYFSVQGVTRFLGSIIRVTGEFEMQRMALRNIVQDVQGADALFGKLQKLAVQSPYTFSEITSYAKQLSAFSVPLDELYDTTKMLADVSAGLGVDMSRMILAYGQVRSAAFLRGQEVRQFTEAGVPLLQELAKQFTELEGRVVSVGEVFDKISKREVSFEMVAKVLKDLTSEGGKFFDMQSVLSETLKGKVMKLKDAYEQMLYSIGEGNSGAFHGIVDAALSAVRNYETLGRIMKEVVLTFGMYQVAAMAVTVASGKMTKASLLLAKAIRFLKANPYAILASGAVAAAAYIYELTQRQTAQQKMQEAVNKSEKEYEKTVMEETSSLKYLLGAMEKATAGTEEYDRAKKSLMKDYGMYMSDLEREKVAVGDLAGLYETLSIKVKESAAKRFREAATTSVDEEYNQGMGDIAKDLESLVSTKSKGLKMALWDYILGTDLDKLPDSYRQEVKDTIDRIEELFNIRDAQTGRRWVSTTIDVLRKRAADLAAVADEQKASILQYFKDEEENAGNAAGQVLAKFQTDINAVLDKTLGAAAMKSQLYIKDNTIQLSDYIDKLRKSYKTLTESIANASPKYQKNEIEQWKKDLEGVEAVAKLLKIDLNKATFKELTTDKPDKLTERQKAQRAEIQATVQVVNKLKDAYEQLKAAIPESMLGAAMKALFPDISSSLRDNFDYDEQLRGLADQLRLIPGEADNADKILANMGKDATKAMTDAFEAAEKFVEEIKSLTSKDFNLDGKGVAFDISKILADLNSKNNKVDLNIEGIREEFEAAKTNELAMKALRIKYGDDFWKKYVEGGDKALTELANKEKAYNRKKAQESVNDLAKRYVSQNIGKGKGIDLTDLSQKSLRQIAVLRKKIKDELENVDIGSLGLSQETTTNLYNSGLRLKDFVKAVKDLLNADLDKVDDEMKEKLLKGAQAAAKGVSQLGDAFVQLGDAMGNDRITSIGETMKGIGDAFANIASGAASGGVWGAVAAAAMEVLKGVTGALANEAAEAREAAQNSTDFANALALMSLEAADLSTVFGKATFLQMAEYFDKGRKAAEAYSEALSDLNMKYGTLELINSGTGAQDDRGFFAFNGPRFNKQIYDIDEALDGLKRMQVKTKDRNWFQQLLGMSDEHTALGNLAPDLWDADGAFNVENAKKFLDTNTQIDDTQRKELQNLVNIKDQYDEIQKKIDDMVGSLVGSLAGDMVDSFLDNFKRVGDAVDDLDSAFQNLGETILKSMLQSYVIDEILNEFGPRVKDMFKQYSEGNISEVDLLDKTAELVDDVNEKTKKSAAFLNRILQAADDRNLLGDGTSSNSSSLSDGIKAVTEDTASLLASYINAIRADVSFAKTQRERVLELLRSAFPSSPTLAEHLAQIQANTYNTAVATQEMLAEFRGVLAPHSEGGNGVKVVTE